MNARLKKIIIFLIADVALLTVSMVLAFLLRFDGTIPPSYQQNIPFYIIITSALTIPLLFWRKLYAFTWAFVSLNEVVELLKATLASGFLFFGVYALFAKTPIFLGFPRSIIFLHYSLTFLFLGALRAAKRIGLMLFDKPLRDASKKRALIIGANESAEELIRIIHKNRDGQRIIGILDDDGEKHATLLHGIRVHGNIAKLPEIARTHNAQAVIIALPEASRKNIQTILSLAKEAEITDIKIIPNLYEMVSGNVTPDQLRDVRMEDLLGRKVAQIQTHEIGNFIKDKDILITGAAGSIGSELCRQMSGFDPRTLYLLDYEESNLFGLTHRLAGEHPSLTIKPIVADVRNEKKMLRVVQAANPRIIFHAAAYKHVPLMEEFPEEAVTTNVLGTLYIAKAALQANVEKFILISTDKAVRPISTMGKTKKLAEMIIQGLNGENGTHFISVRFGNVLGSRGSVLPIFQEQLRRRLPLTITDARMARYFMTAPEACLLVLEAASSGIGGEIFVLDMGKPVRIVDLAKELIRFHGLRPNKDIPIVYTKPRPGEKFFEDIFSDQENMVATRYQKIFKTKITQSVSHQTFLQDVEDLKRYIEEPEKLVKELTKLTKT